MLRVVPAREYKSLLVDFGGVLTTNIWVSFDRFCEAEGLEPGAVLRLFRDDPEALSDLRKLECGEYSDQEFEERFARRLGVAREGLISRMFAGLEPEEAMIDAVKSARGAGLQTALISNSWGTGIYERAPMEIFDAVIVSGDVGLHKPQPEIYLLAAERVATEPEACVFVDDLRENIEGAEAVGMTGVLHRDPAVTLERLGRLLDLDLSSKARS